MALLGLLNIASTAAFSAILSLSVVALQISYLMPVTAILWLRLRASKDIVWSPWRLRPSVGMAANMISICYTTLTVAFLPLPPTRPVTARNMDYARAVLGSVLIACTIGWFGHGRKQYRGPFVNIDGGIHVVSTEAR